MIEDRVRRIYKKILKNNKVKNKPTLYFTYFLNKHSFFYIRSRNVIGIRSWAAVCENDDELAFILGHELGHANQPRHIFRSTDSFVSEDSADMLGVLYAYSAGFNVREGVKTFLTKDYRTTPGIEHRRKDAWYLEPIKWVQYTHRNNFYRYEFIKRIIG